MVRVPSVFYRALLKCFPPRFRQVREKEMVFLFETMRNDPLNLGPGARIRFWVRLVADTLGGAVREHINPSLPAPNKHSRKGSFMSAIISDVRYAVRLLVRQPGFAAMTVLMITLAIAGNAAVFRVFDGLFLRPLPFESPGQLMDMDETAPAWDLEYVGIAYADFAEWRRSNETFASMGVLTTTGVNVAGEGDATRAVVVAASYDLPATVGLEPVTGRFFTAEEDIPDGANVILVSRSYWMNDLGGRDDVLGTTVSLDGEAHEIIGVLPDLAQRIVEADIWAPLGMDESNTSGWFLTGVGRLKPGVTMDQALADLTRVHKGMVENRSVNEITSPVIQPLRERYLGEFRLGSSALLAATALVLIIACANIAGLMLARGLHRGREYGIRVAIGAGRGQLARQLFIESLLLALIGGVLGTFLGFVGSGALVDKMAEQFPAFVSFEMNPRLIAFMAVATMGATVMFGSVPSISATRVSANSVLNAASDRSSGAPGKRRSMNVLVAGEVALALLLLIVAGLRVEDLRSLQNVDPGYNQESLLTYAFRMASDDFSDGEQRVAFLSEHLERVRALPGVVNATAASNLPLTGHWGWFFHAEGAEPRSEDEGNPVVLNRAVADNYFETMGVRFKAGRPFLRGEGGDSSGVIIVNETFAATFFPGVENPVGKRVAPGTDGGDHWMTIVGLTYDVKHYGVDEEMRPGVYQPLTQIPLQTPRVAVRTSVAPTSVVSALRETMREEDSGIALYSMQTMAERMDEALWTRKASSWLIFLFSAVALVLAVAGVYGVISHSVGQRVKEMSIRMALGASGGQVLRQVLLQGMLLVTAGAALGLVAALAAARVMSSLLVSVSATDPLIFAGVTGVLLLFAGVANAIPAFRASRFHPMRALREE